MVEEKYKYKVVVIGMSGVGKTSILNSLNSYKFSDKVRPSDSVKQTNFKVELQGMQKAVELDLWDLPGKESFTALNRMYIRNTNAAIIVYDVNNKQSLDDTESWISEM